MKQKEQDLTEEELKVIWLEMKAKEQAQLEADLQRGKKIFKLMLPGLGFVVIYASCDFLLAALGIGFETRRVMIGGACFLTLVFMWPDIIKEFRH